MTKIRVYEYAKKHNVSSKVIIEKLKEMNIQLRLMKMAEQV